ncbi:MAG: AMP-binding protein [Acidimicrobiaceae bacterium]|nr:AMP-binding protein [Acidimicrobiaceae bacterium]
MSSPRNIPDIALRSAQQFGDRTAIVDGDICLTFTEVRDEMLKVACALTATGIQPGDRIGLWAPNSAVWITSALGILASGAWLVPINTRFKATEVATILDTVDASLLFVSEDFVAKKQLEAIGLDAPVLLPGLGEATRPEWEAFLGRASGSDPEVVLDRISRIGPEDVSDVMFTSGTTGKPKGVMLRHGTTIRAYSDFNARYGVGEGDRSLVALPFFHCFGYKAGWMVDLLAGATTYPLAVFDTRTVMSMIERYAITHLPGAPTMFWSVLEDPDRARYDLSSVRASIIGAAAIPVELVRRVRDDLGVNTVLAGYGLTESHALVSISMPGDTPELVATTVGKVLDSLEVRTIDSEGRPLPPGAEGELMVRGHVQMTGYYRDPEATAAAFTDGWLHTGDIGTVDEQGYVRITDRKKDIYITGGFNVAPAEVENVLAACEKISQVAVVGVPDERMGEVGAAFVVPASGLPTTAEDIVAYARERLANFKVPRHVLLVDALPTNATGKVLKDELRSRFRAGSIIPD